MALINPVAALCLWSVAVVGFGLIMAAIVGATFTGFANCSDPLADSASTPLGWSLAAFAVVSPVVAAVVLYRLSRWWPILMVAMIVAVIEAGLWYVMIAGSGPGC